MAGQDRDVELAVMQLLERAYEQLSSERVAFIKAQKDVTKKVRKRALALLEEDQATHPSLQTGGAQLAEEDDSVVPERIGAYRVLRLIGRGGMGNVYLAERASDDFDQVAAIKLIKPGILSDSLVERFRRERQLLAGLRHKNIAHLYDGGETDDGAPYIIMEYVDGLPLSKWVKQNQPDMAQRLKLFQQICDAVAHAHQNLIIHRDLTPSNVLVTDTGEAKLIDFGIAKPQADEGEGDTPSTFSGLSLTPGYAAPERSKGVDANTLSDIYSLGKILKMLVGDETNQEIGSIVDKATSTDPSERYMTVSALADDVMRWKNGEAVPAYSSAAAYRLSKFVSRHKIGTAATLVGAVLLIGAFVATLVQYQNAQTRFAETRELTSFLLEDLPEDLGALPGTLPALEKVTATSASYLDILALAAESDDSVLLEYATGRTRLGELLTEAGGNNLGKPEEGIKNFELGIAALRKLVNRRGTNAGTQMALASALTNMAHAKIHHLGANDAAAVQLKESMEICEQMLAKEPDDPDFLALIGINFSILGNIEVDHKRPPFETIDRAREVSTELHNRFGRKSESQNIELSKRRSLILTRIANSAHNHWEFNNKRSIPITDRSRFEAAVKDINEALLINESLVRKFPVNPSFKRSYTVATIYKTGLLTFDREWETDRDQLIDLLAISAKTGGQSAVRTTVDTDPRFKSRRDAGVELDKNLTLTDEYLSALAPFESQFFGHIETTFYMLRAHAHVEARLNFDFDENLKYLDQALAMTVAFLEANPDFRNAYMEQAEVQTEKALTLTEIQAIYGGNIESEACELLRTAEQTWKLVEKRWGKIDDYRMQREETPALIAAYRC